MSDRCFVRGIDEIQQLPTNFPYLLAVKGRHWTKERVGPINMRRYRRIPRQ